MSNQTLDLNDFLEDEISKKSDALESLDRTALIGISILTLLITVVIFLTFFSL